MPGRVGSVTPSTNPAATVINNAISLIAAGNSVVFCPASGGAVVCPQRAITSSIRRWSPPVARKFAGHRGEPDIETAQRLFKHPGIGLLVATGARVVDAARKQAQ